MDSTKMHIDAAPEPCAALFPMLEAQAYLDTATMGLSASLMADAAAQFYRDKAQGTLGRHLWQEKAASLRARIGGWLGVKPEEVEFFSGTTDALNLLAHSIVWRAGDEVVLAADEFPSVRLAWTVAERAGAVIRLIPIPSEHDRSAALAAAVTANTRLLVASHVHSTTGTRLDLDQVGAACRKRGCLFVVDGIQALGATPVSMQYVDAYVAGVIKWLLAGFGLAVCVAREPLREVIRPSFLGYLNAPPQTGIQFAHCNYPGLYALEASLRLLGDTLGWDTIYGRTTQLVDWLAEDLAKMGVPLAAPAGSRAGIASFSVRDPEAARVALLGQGIQVAARGKFIRSSPFFYNSRDHLRELVAHVQPFL